MRGRMIDGVKLRIRGRNRTRLRAHPLLHWRWVGFFPNNQPKFEARWDVFIFTGNAHECTKMRGSFHRYSQGGTNWQKFTREQFVAKVEDVCLVFGLHDAELLLEGGAVEVGLNLVAPIRVEEFLPCIVCHKEAAPDRMPEGVGITIEHDRFKFKVYDKTRDTKDKAGRVTDPNAARIGDLTDNLMRFEVNAQAAELRRLGIRTLADLCTAGAWTALGIYLVTKFDELVIMDPELRSGVPTKGLTPTQCEVLERGTDAKYWSKGMSRDQRYRRRDALRALRANICPSGVHATVRASIVAQVEELSEQGPAMFAPTGSPPPRQQFATFGQLVVKGANVANGGRSLPGSDGLPSGTPRPDAVPQETRVPIRATAARDCADPRG